MPRASLQSSLDREIYPIVRRYQEEKPDGDLKVFLVYNYIQRSNSSLKRRPKNVMEASLERVIDVIKQDEEEQDDDSEGNIEFTMSDESRSKSVALTPRPINRPIGKHKRATLESDKKEEVLTLSNGIIPTKKRKQKHEGDVNHDNKAQSAYNLADLGGVDNIIDQLENLLVLPLLRPQKYTAFHIPIPRGILLHGPPGCGKTMISRAFAAEIGVPFVEILGPSIVSGMSGESEQKLREKFEEAKRLAPCLIFIDEIDVIAPKRESSQSQMEKRIVAQLLISMDGISLTSNDGKPVIVLASTNRPDSLDPALRRGGRFDTEIMMGVPNEKMREMILRAQLREISISEDMDFTKLAKMTAGFVGADLADMVGKAGSWRMEQYREALRQETATDHDSMDVDTATADRNVMSPRLKRLQRLIARAKDVTRPDPPGFEELTLNMAAFLAVLPDITPSSKREGFATIPDTTWENIGALENVREELVRSVVHPIAAPGKYEAVGIKPPTGVLLWGPPGCGKTLLAKAVANESKANFISVKGPELFNKYLGESERSVRQVFLRARSSVPCVLFFDELDALVPNREGGGGNEASARVVNTLLTELDGLNSRDGIYIIGATNRPDIIDPAMLRPGRLEKLLYVGLPGPSERAAIFRTLVSRTPIDPSLAEFASSEACANFSGADLESLIRQAGLMTLERGSMSIQAEDFTAAVTKIRPSVQNIERYERMKIKLQSG